MGDPAVERLLSCEHFSVDGTLIDAWASMRCFQRKDGQDDPLSGLGRNAERDVRGEKREPTGPTPPPLIQTRAFAASRTASHHACASWGTC